MQEMTQSLPDPVWVDVSPRSVELQKKLWNFMKQNIFPIETDLEKKIELSGDRWRIPQDIEELKDKAKKVCFFRLFVVTEFGWSIS